MAVPGKYGFKSNKDIQDMDAAISAKFTSLLDKMFPVGAIVITTDDRTPQDKGYPGSDWRLICDGRTIIGRASGSSVQPTHTGGNKGAAHSHIIYAGEDWNTTLPDHAPAPETVDGRQIYADMIPANSPNVNQAASKEASGGQCEWHFLLHADWEHSQFDPNDPTKYELADAQLGKLEVRPTWTTTVLTNGDEYTLSQNRITAQPYDDGSGTLDPMPPYMVMNIWRRYA